MSKNKDNNAEEMRPEYDFSGGVRGKYAQRYAEGSNVIVIDADLTDVFPNAESVNRALRALAEIIREQRKAS
ncbi:MAG: hypothetical protein ACREIG_06375 [Nitrospiraceae bacterium]